MQINSFFKTLLLSSVLLLSACGGGSSSEATVQTRSVEVEFDVVSSSASAITSLTCDTVVSDIGSNATRAKFQDMRFYVSNASFLVKQLDGSEIKVPITLSSNAWNYSSGANSVTLIDMENKSGSCSGTRETNYKLVGTISSTAGQVLTGIEFTLGVPFEFNHTALAAMPAPLNIAAMGWSWQSGRKFAKIELVDSGDNLISWSNSGFSFHLASTNCVGNPANGQTVSCVQPNRMSYHSHSFDYQTQKIAINLTGFLASSAIEVANSSCMSEIGNTHCDPLFAGVKVDQTTGLPIDGGHGQRLFKVISK